MTWESLRIIDCDSKTRINKGYTTIGLINCFIIISNRALWTKMVMSVRYNAPTHKQNKTRTHCSRMRSTRFSGQHYISVPMGVFLKWTSLSRSPVLTIRCHYVTSRRADLCPEGCVSWVGYPRGGYPRSHVLGGGYSMPQVLGCAIPCDTSFNVCDVTYPPMDRHTPMKTLPSNN